MQRVDLPSKLRVCDVFQGDLMADALIRVPSDNLITAACASFVVYLLRFAGNDTPSKRNFHVVARLYRWLDDEEQRSRGN